MMKIIFGDKKRFAIEYNLVKHPYGDETGILRDSWGILRIWLKDIDLLGAKSYRGGGPASYQWNICYIAEWLAKNFHSIIEEEKFPGNTAAKNYTEFHKKYYELMPNMDDEPEEFRKWHEEIYHWNQRHWFRMSADGSLLPNLFLRACGENIEFCWNNQGLYDDENIIFNSIYGCDYIGKDYFRAVILDFLKYFYELFKAKYPENFKDYNLMTKQAN